jgi:hypothetical protein
MAQKFYFEWRFLEFSQIQEIKRRRETEETQDVVAEAGDEQKAQDTEKPKRWRRRAI